MTKVYCKKDYLTKIYDRYFYKHKTYYVHENYIYTDNIFVFTQMRTDLIPDNGMWFSNQEFEEYFTYDKKIVRQAKLERICNKI